MFSVHFFFSVINVAGISVTGKDMLDIGEKTRLLPGRVCKSIFTIFEINVAHFNLWFSFPSRS